MDYLSVVWFLVWWVGYTKFSELERLEPAEFDFGDGTTPCRLDAANASAGQSNCRY